MSTYRASGLAELTHACWRKSAYSATTGACVEVAELTGGHHAVRDSKDPSGPALIFTPAEWTTFTTAVRSGNFD